VDALMTDGVALLGTTFSGVRQTSAWTDELGTNLVDIGTPHYDVYETADGRYLAVGAIEPHFCAEVLKLLALDAAELPPHTDRDQWLALKQIIAIKIRTRTLDEWIAANAGTARVSVRSSPPTKPFTPATGARDLQEDRGVQPAGVRAEVQPGPSMCPDPAARADGAHPDEARRVVDSSCAGYCLGLPAPPNHRTPRPRSLAGASVTSNPTSPDARSNV